MKSFSSIDRSRYYILEQISRKYYYENKNNNETAHSRIELKDLDYTEQLGKSLRLSQKSLGQDNNGQISGYNMGGSHSQYQSSRASKSNGNQNQNYKMDLAHSSFNQENMQYVMNSQNSAQIVQNIDQEYQNNNQQQQNVMFSKKDISDSSSSMSKQNRLGMKLMSTQNIIVGDKSSSTTSEKNSFQSITPVDYQNYEQNAMNNVQSIKKSVHFQDGLYDIAEHQNSMQYNNTVQHQINNINNQIQYDKENLQQNAGFQKISEIQPEKHSIAVQTEEIQSNNSTPSIISRHRYEQLLEQLNKYNQLLDSMYGWQVFSDNQVFKLQNRINNIKNDIQQIQPTEDDFDEKIMQMGANLKEFFNSVRKASDNMIIEKKQMIEEKGNLQQIIEGLKAQISELSILEGNAELKDNSIADLHQQILKEKQNYQCALAEQKELKNQILNLQNQLKQEQQQKLMYEEKSINAAIDLIDHGINTNFDQEEDYIGQINTQNMQLDQLKQNQNIMAQQFQHQVHLFKQKLIEQLKNQHEIRKMNVNYDTLYTNVKI